jgi:putative ABC transport system substrate-binding protein
VQGAIRSAYEQGAGALLFLASPTFTSHRKAIVELVRRYRLPAVYDVRSYVEAGGLMSYAASFVDAYRQAGRYAGRIIHGASPSDLPVLQPAKFKFTLNLKAAREIGVSIPEWFLVQADDIIE